MNRIRTIAVFPLTNKSAHLEQLAKVSPGTIAKLRKFEQEQGLNYSYSILSLPKGELRRMRHFEMFGFGKIPPSELEIILKLAISVADSQLEIEAGSTTDSNLVFWLLQYFGKDTRLNQQLCEGLGWC